MIQIDDDQFQNLSLLLNRIADIAGSEGNSDIEKLTEQAIAILGLVQIQNSVTQKME